MGATIPDRQRLAERVASLLHTRQFSAACGELEKYCKKNPTDGGAWLNLSSIHGQMGHYQEAAKYARKAIKLLPDNVNAHGYLANALAALGQHSKALASYRTALKLQPGDPGVLTNLATAHLQVGNTTEAERLLKDVLIKQPDHWNAHLIQGDLCFLRGQLEDSISHYEQVVQALPGHHTAHGRLGRALVRSGKLKAAIQAMQTALQLQPDDPEINADLGAALVESGDIRNAIAHLNQATQHRHATPIRYTSLASALLLDGKLEEALQKFRTARSLQASFVPAIEGEADCLFRLGHHGQAASLLDGLIKQNKISARGAATFSHISKETGDCETAAKTLRTITNRKNPDENEYLIAHFALGSLLDHMQHYDSAFKHYKQANKLLINHSYSPESSETFTSNIIKLITPDAWPTLPRASVSGHQPIFIVGMPRSGTSLTEQILASHPQVYGAGELTFMNDSYRTLAAEPDFPDTLKRLDQERVNQLAAQYLQQARTRSPEARIITDKMPGNIFYLGLIALLFPHARIIHCTRHPIDTCLSVYFQRFSAALAFAADLRHIGHYYSQYRRIAAHWMKFPQIPVMEIQYESLVNEQEKYSRKLLEHCGLEWHDDCLNFHRSARHVATASFDQANKPIYYKSVARWKHYQDHLQPLIDALGDYAHEEAGEALTGRYNP